MKIKAEDLRSCAFSLLTAAGETCENAKAIADIYVRTDARGIVTHGTYMLGLIYERVRAGQFALPTRVDVVQDDGATAILDGGDGIGQMAGLAAAETAIEKARKYGIATVLIRNTNNIGPLSLYTELVAREGMIAFLCCNASPAMSPWGGMEPFVGTQPFAFAIYAGNAPLFSADMATSVVARGKIRKAARDGLSIPDNWALDRDGRPTTDAGAAVAGTVLPIGGPKGSAIGLAIDIISGMLSGSSWAPDVKPIHTASGRAGVGGYMYALDIARFCDLAQFERDMADYIARVKGLKKAQGFDEILLPGEIEMRREARQMREGIELDERAVETLNRLLTETGSPLRLSESQ